MLTAEEILQIIKEERAIVLKELSDSLLEAMIRREYKLVLSEQDKSNSKA